MKILIFRGRNISFVIKVAAHKVGVILDKIEDLSKETENRKCWMYLHKTPRLNNPPKVPRPVNLK